MTSHMIGEGRHKLLIGEHPENCYVASYVDGSCIGGFYTEEQITEMICALWAVRRRIRKRTSAAA